MENLKKLLSSGKVKIEPVTGDEIAARIKKAGLYLDQGCFGEGLPDIQFQTIYDAGRMLCEVVIRAEGFRVTAGAGHHYYVISLMSEILGDIADPVRNQLDNARQLRNDLMYEVLFNAIEQKDINELCKAVKQFQSIVLEWLKEAHHNLIG
jgi:hypothetical protein